MAVVFQWRGDFRNDEVNQLHAQAFGTPPGGDGERDWEELVRRHSLGWVIARDGDGLVGFVNVIGDGSVHAWLQDTMVANEARAQGTGTRLVTTARHRAQEAGCRWLHVDFDDNLKPFYIDACGFAPTSAGLIAL
jgi:GNAT superfamily N-acetyltransferase